MATAEVKRTFAFRLSEDDFDRRGDMRSFAGEEQKRGPRDRSETYY